MRGQARPIIECDEYVAVRLENWTIFKKEGFEKQRFESPPPLIAQVFMRGETFVLSTQLNMTVQFGATTTKERAEQVLNGYGLVIKGTLGWVKNMYEVGSDVECTTNSYLYPDILDLAEQIRNHPEVLIVEPLFLEKIGGR